MLSVTITEKDGPTTTTSFDKTEVLIGRVKGNDIVLPKSNVSKRHSRIVVKDGKVILIDLKSTNGTFINGRKITGPHVMQEGDRVFIGDYTIDVRDVGGPATLSAAPASAGVSNPLPSFNAPAGAPSLSGMPSLESHGGGHGPSLVPPPQASGFPRPSLSGVPSLGSSGTMLPGGPTLAAAPSVPGVGLGGSLPPLGNAPSLNPPSLGGSMGSSLGVGSSHSPLSVPSISPAPSMGNNGVAMGAGSHAVSSAEEELGLASNVEEEEKAPFELSPAAVSSQLPPASSLPSLGASPLPAAPSLGTPSLGASPLPATPSLGASSLSAAPSLGASTLPSAPSLGASPLGASPLPSLGVGLSPLPNGARGVASSSVGASAKVPSSSPVLSKANDGVIDKSLRFSQDASANSASSQSVREIYAASLPDDMVIDDARNMESDAWLKAARMVMDKYLNETDFQTLLSQPYPPESEIQDNCYNELTRCLNECRGALGNVDCNSILDYLLKEACGLGAIDSLIDDADVSAFVVYNFETIVVERKGRREISNVQFTSNDTLYLAAQRLFMFQGINPQTTSAISEIRFGDGTQIQVILPPVSVSSTMITVRKINREFVPLTALVQRDMLSESMDKFLKLCVKAKRNILIVGPQGGGKTSVLNALGCEISNGERIVTVENSASLVLPQLYVMNLEVQNGAFQDGDMASLIRQSGRLRAERVLVDTLQTSEDVSAFMSAICSGASGSMATVNGMTAREGFSMVKRMLASGYASMVGNIDIVVAVRAFTSGCRRIVEIAEVVEHEEGYRLEPIYVWNKTGMGEMAMGEGRFMATGHVPQFYRELERGGTALDASIFN